MTLNKQVLFDPQIPRYVATGQNLLPRAGNIFDLLNFVIPMVPFEWHLYLLLI